MTNNKQQTAVDWFAKKVMHLDWKFSNQKEKEKIIQQAQEMHRQQAEHYATFITNCVINNLPTITFNDWINLHNNEQQ